MAGLDCGFVVIGFDGTPEGVAALRWGLERASRLASAAKIVHCWPPAARGSARHGVGRATHRRVEAVRVVENEVTAASRLLPEPPEVSMVFSSAAVPAALAAQCRGARMLVLGASAPGVLIDPRRGPVAGPCLDRVGCPVSLVDRHGRVTTTEPRHPALELAG